MLVGKSRGGSVGRVTRLWAGESGARTLVREIGPSSTKHPDRLWVPPGLPYNCYRCSFPVEKRPEREVGHSPSSSAAVKNVGSYTPTTPICLQSINRDNFTLISMGKLQKQLSL